MATDAETAALAAAVRALNIAKPSYGQARAALRAAIEVLSSARPSAQKLPGALKAAALGLTVTAATAARDLDGAVVLVRSASKALGDGAPAVAMVPAKAWAEVQRAVTGAYRVAFAVKATAGDASAVSFTGELAKLSQNLSEAPAFFDAGAKALGNRVAQVTGAAANVVGSTAGGLVKGLWPVLLVLGVLLVLAAKTGVLQTVVRR